mgnify:CR=1 FL=1
MLNKMTISSEISQRSYFLNFRRGYVGVILFDLELGVLNEVSVALVVFWHAMSIAV